MDQHNKTTDEVSRWHYNYVYKGNHIEITNTHIISSLSLFLDLCSLLMMIIMDGLWERKKKENFNNLYLQWPIRRVSLLHILLVAENQLWRMIIQLLSLLPWSAAKCWTVVSSSHSRAARARFSQGIPSLICLMVINKLITINSIYGKLNLKQQDPQEQYLDWKCTTKTLFNGVRITSSTPNGQLKKHLILEYCTLPSM